jgi:hypothetical protein
MDKTVESPIKLFSYSCKMRHHIVAKRKEMVLSGFRWIHKGEQILHFLVGPYCFSGLTEIGSGSSKKSNRVVREEIQGNFNLTV